MKCKNCGKEINEESKFCLYCGKEVEEAQVEEIVEVKNSKKQKEPVNPTIPTLGLAIAIGVYISSYLLIKLRDTLIGFGDYILFLFLIPLGILGMIFSSIGRVSTATRTIKIVSWTAFGLLIFDYILLFIALMMYIS